MLEDANDANNMHNSFTRRVTTTLIINYQLPRHSERLSLTRTTLAPEQLNIKLFQFSTCSVQCKSVHAQCKSVHLHTKFLTRTMVRLSDADHVLPPSASCVLYALH